VSDRSCDYKMRAGTTHSLEVETAEDDVSERGCDHKTRAQMTYGLKVEREGNLSDCGCNYKARVETTYRLEVERVTCQIAVETTKRGQGRRTPWR
jgi:hypothetical protein